MSKPSAAVPALGLKPLLKKYLNASPLIIFAPFLLFFLVFVIKVSVNKLQGDESRYYEFAQNLLHGFYSPPAPGINLWSGPGYPIFLTPFLLLKLPILAIKLANAVLQYLSIILLFCAVRNYTSHTKALIVAFIWACYYVAYQEMPLVLTETFTSFLATLILYLVTKVYSNAPAQKRFRWFLGITIGFLVLTKIIFSYVLLSLLVISALAFLYKRNDQTKKTLIVLFIALLVNIPYLLYTRHLTHKLFYWGNSGGMSLYWMSTPVKNEFGDWNNPTFTANCGLNGSNFCNADSFAVYHQKDFDYVYSLPVIDQDDAFKRMAIDNIRNHPKKYINNCVANLGRLFFGMPVSYFYQREETLYRFPPGAFTLVLLLVAIVVTVVYFKHIPIELRLVAGMLILYLACSMLVSAYPRQLYVVVPLLLFWVAALLDRFIIFKLPTISSPARK